MQYEDISVTVTNRIGSITIARPDKGNALRPQTLSEICAAIDQLAEDSDCAVLMLRAEGKHFSAGADFAFLEKLPETPAVDIRKDVYEHFQGAARRLYSCPKPTLAVVQGAAVTVGCELAVAADFRIASEDAYFQESWIKLGIMPPLGGTFLLPRLIGLGRAAEMVLRAKMVKAAEALAIGLVSQVVPRETLDEAANTLAGELAASAPLAYRAVKEALHRGLESNMSMEWSANLSTQAFLLGTEDFRSGLTAVQQRRAPIFKGR